MTMFVMFNGIVYSVEDFDGTTLYLLDEDGGTAEASFEQVEFI